MKESTIYVLLSLLFAFLTIALVLLAVFMSKPF